MSEPEITLRHRPSDHRTYITRWGAVLDFGSPEALREFGRWLAYDTPDDSAGVLVFPSRRGEACVKRAVRFALEKRKEESCET